MNSNSSPGPISVRSDELMNLSLIKLPTKLQHRESASQQSAVPAGKCHTGDTPYFLSQRRIELAAYGSTARTTWYYASTRRTTD